MRIRQLNPRKILVASMGVATMSYVIACGSSQNPVGNLAAVDSAGGSGDSAGGNVDSSSGATDGPNDHATVDDFPVANLVANPDSGPPPDVGNPDTGGSGDTGSGDTGGPPDTGPVDVKLKDTIDDFPVANLVAHPG